jgi:hypothetical protein
VPVVTVPEKQAGVAQPVFWKNRRGELHDRAHRFGEQINNPMTEFLSDDDLLTFEGFLKSQCPGVDPATMTPDELKAVQGWFDESRRLRNTSPKRMKLKPDLDEQKYAVAIRDGSDLWLTLWVRCSPKGEIFLMYPGPDPGNPHVSYHLDGTLHQKGHGFVGISQKRQPLTAAFKGSEHLGTYGGGHGTKSIGAVCDPKAFDGVVIVEPGILGLGSVGVDLVEPGYEPDWNRDMGCQRFYLNGVYQRQVFPRNGRPSVVITIQR